MKKLAVIGASMAILVAVAVVAFQPSHDHGSVTTPTAFDLPALTGSGRVMLRAYQGKPVVVNLFASWCTECLTELPAFARAAHDLSGKVQFIGVDSMETGDGRGMATRFKLAAAGFVLARDVGPGGSGLHDAIHAPGMPATIFYDAEGRILGRDIAAVPESLLRTQLQQYYGVS